MKILKPTCLLMALTVFSTSFAQTSGESDPEEPKELETRLDPELPTRPVIERDIRRIEHMTPQMRSGGVGNGGDAVVCPNSVMLLDHFEVLKRFDVDLADGLQKPTHRAIVNEAVTRLIKKDIHTAQKLYEYSMEMVNDLELYDMHPGAKGRALYLGHNVLSEVNDSFHISLPVGCEIRQLVIQKQPRFRHEYRYEVNQGLWERMDILDQSLTVLHEAWYRIMLENGAHDSRGARYMNGLLASSVFEGISFSEYIDDLKETELKNFVVLNNSGAIADSEVLINLKDSRMTLEGEKVCVPDISITTNLRRWYPVIGLKKINIPFEKVCFKDSRLVSMVIPAKKAREPFNLVMDNFFLRISGDGKASPEMLFHKSGKFKQMLNVESSVLYKLFYECGREKKKSFERGPDCKGPFLFYKSKIENPGDVVFDEDEAPVGFEFPFTL